MNIKELQIEIEKVEKSLSRAMYLKDNEAIDDYVEELCCLKRELKQECSKDKNGVLSKNR